MVCNSTLDFYIHLVAKMKKSRSHLSPSLSLTSQIIPSDNHIKYSFEFILNVFTWLHLQSNPFKSWYYILTSDSAAASKLVSLLLFLYLYSLKPLWSFKYKIILNTVIPKRMLSIYNKLGLEPGTWCYLWSSFLLEPNFLVSTAKQLQ